MYKIGEFSILCETTLKTLRHYDEKGILKPCKVDEFSGYRYYSEEQVSLFRKIKNLQNSGFSLEEVKQIISNRDKNLIDNKIDNLEKETKNKIKVLREMKSDMIRKDFEKVNNVTFEPNLLSYCAFEYAEVRSRKDIQKILKRLDRKLENKGVIYNKNVYFVENNDFCYKEKDIACFIGRFVSEKDVERIHAKRKHRMKRGKLMFSCDDKIETCLHTKVDSSIIKAYQDIIEFANKNNIQIRGAFKEVYNNGEIDVYIEAYDLLDNDTDTIEYVNRKLSELKNEVDHKFVGKWQMVAEMSLNPILFNPKRKYYKPVSKLDLLILNKDGTTNINNITWKEDKLIIKKNSFTDFGYIHILWKKEGVSIRKNYITILINTIDSPSARPYFFIYKKIK